MSIKQDKLRQFVREVAADPAATQHKKLDAILALSEDTHETVRDLNGRLIDVEQELAEIQRHPFHQVSPKTIVYGIIGVFSMSVVYIKESRDWIIGLFFP